MPHFILQSVFPEFLVRFFKDFWPPVQDTVLTIIGVLLIYTIANFILKRQIKGHSDGLLIKQIILFLLGLFGFISIVIAPLGPELQKEVLQLLGIVLSATFALASTTFLGNALAGIMNRITNSCEPGDFIRIGDYSGRISDRGLFHIELQTEDRDLTTLPNLFLANNPVKVIRNSGTIISAVASLGYDVPRKKIEAALIEAAKEADLSEPFVYITELGDFSIVYKIHGMLTDTKRILTAKSRLHAMMLDKLHEADIEIVSPSFMNQRQVNETVFIPEQQKHLEPEIEVEAPEEIMFDKAEQASSVELQKQRMSVLDNKLTELTQKLKDAPDQQSKKAYTEQINLVEELKKTTQERLDKGMEELKKKE